MKVIDFEVVSVQLSEEKQYQLRFLDGKFQTETATKSATPKFRKNKFQYACDNYVEGQANFQVSIISIGENGEEVVEGREEIELGFSKFIREFEVNFKQRKGHTVTGVIKFFYKFARLTLVDSLKKEDVACISICAAHLNTLVESSFELKILVNSPDFPDMLIGTAKLTHSSPSAYVDVSGDVSAYQLIITDPLQPTVFYAVDIDAGAPVVVPIPQTVGDPIVLTVHLCTGKSMVTATFHSSAMRDAAITVDPNSKERRVSLSPRRTSSWDDSAVAAGLIGTGQAIASTKKTLLYLEDTAVIVSPTLNHTIVAGVVPAVPLNDQGEPFPDDVMAIVNDHKVLLTGRMPAVGPRGGSYMVCNSKSDMLENEKKRKSHKRQLHGTNLGLLHVSKDALVNPVRIRASLMDLQFEKTESLSEAAIDADGKLLDPSKLNKFKQKTVLAFVGTLEETSRELFNETGLLACTLEGKLYKPMSAGLNMASNIAAAAAKAAATVEGEDDVDSAAAGSTGTDTESCVAIKLYCSLVPSAEVGEENEDEAVAPVIRTVESADEKQLQEAVADEAVAGEAAAAEEAAATAAEVEAVAAEEPVNETEQDAQAAEENNASPAPAPASADGSPDGSALLVSAAPSTAANEAVDNSISLSVVEKEINEWEAKKAQEAIAAAEHAAHDGDVYNAVDSSIEGARSTVGNTATADPDELPGSSVLNVPNAKLTREDLVTSQQEKPQLTAVQLAMEEQIDKKIKGGYSPTAAAAAVATNAPSSAAIADHNSDDDGEDDDEAVEDNNTNAELGPPLVARRPSEASADSMVRRIVSGEEADPDHDQVQGEHWSVGHSLAAVESPDNLQRLSSDIQQSDSAGFAGADASGGESTDTADYIAVPNSRGSGSMSARMSGRSSAAGDHELMQDGSVEHLFSGDDHAADGLLKSASLSTRISKKPSKQKLKKNAQSTGPFGEGLDAAAVMRGIGGAAAVNPNAVVFAEVVRSELNEKQKLIEQLMKEVSSRTESIQVVGKDIRELREEKIALQNKIKALEADKEQMLEDAEKSNRDTEHILRTTNAMNEMDKADIIRCANKMREQLNATVSDKLALQKAMMSAKGAIKEFAELKKGHKKLQEAHMEQEKHIRKMQSKIDRVDDYKRTIQTQEKVISKMQRIIETKMRSNKGDNPILAMAASDAAAAAAAAAAAVPPASVPKSTSSTKPSTPSTEKMVPEAMLVEAQKEVSELHEKVTEMEQQLYDAKLNSYASKGKRTRRGGSGFSTARDSEDGEDLDDIDDEERGKRSNFTDVRAANARIDELEAEMTGKDFRIGALERQLETSTKDYSREIARLRTKLFELEISASMAAGAGGDADDYDDDTALDDDARLRKMLGLPDDAPLGNAAADDVNKAASIAADGSINSARNKSRDTAAEEDGNNNNNNNGGNNEASHGSAAESGLSEDLGANAVKHLNSMVSLPSVSSISMSRPPTQLAAELAADTPPVPSGSARSAVHALQSSDTDEIEQTALKRSSADAAAVHDSYPFTKDFGVSESVKSNIDNIPTPSELLSPAQSFDASSVKMTRNDDDSLLKQLHSVTEEERHQLLNDINTVDGQSQRQLDEASLKADPERYKKQPVPPGLDGEDAEEIHNINSMDGRSQREQDEASLKADPERYKKQPVPHGLDEEEAQKVQSINAFDGMSEKIRDQVATQAEQEEMLIKKIQAAEAAQKAAEERAAAEAAEKAAREEEERKRKEVTPENVGELLVSNVIDGQSERRRDAAVAAEEEKHGQDAAAEAHRKELEAAEEAERKRKAEEKVDKVVQLTIDINHADARSLKMAHKPGDKPLTLHPSTINLKKLLEDEKRKAEQAGQASAEANPPPRGLHPRHCGKVEMTLHYTYDPDSEDSTFNIRKLHLSNFSKEEIEDRFHPYLHLRFSTTGWSCKTNPLESKGMEAEWHFDSKGFSEFDKQFKVSAADLEEDAELLVFMKKLNPKAHEDFLIGFATVDLNDVRDMSPI